MLAITREPGERFRLTGPDGTVAWVKVAEVRGRKVRLAIDAPAAVRVEREELVGRPPAAKD